MVDQAEQSVRFSSQNQEIEPETGLHAVATLTGHDDKDRQVLSPEAQEELRQLRTTLQNDVQSSRMQQHFFEPVSLPGSQYPSRVSPAAQS